MIKGAKVRTEGGRIIITFDINEFIAPLKSQVPLKNVNIKTEGTSIIVEAEIDQDELIRKAQIG